MNIRVNTFAEIKEDIIRTDRRIVIYGSGMIGSVTTMALLDELDLTGRIAFFVDGDPAKQGSFITNIPVYSKDSLKNIHEKTHILFLAVSRFYHLLEELDAILNLEKVDCYIVPMLCLENFKSAVDFFIEKKKETACIPKVIHYIWLGKHPLPKGLEKCIDSWKKYCPDYELKLWNEDNYDIEKIPYMKQAYEAGAYGFVPDFARIDILYRYGGIYLDTDVELIRNIDELLYQEAFCCVEKWQTINFGGGSGAVPKHKMLGELLREREQISFIEADGRQNRNTCGYYDTRFFMEQGYKINGKLQDVHGVTVYPYEVFQPYDYMSGRIEKTVNTYGIHHFNGGWLDEDQANANKLTMQNYEKVYARVVNGGKDYAF